MSSLRPAVERRSAVALAFLAQQPRLLLPALVLGLLLLSSFLPPVPSTVCVLVVLLLAGWLSYLSWPVLDGRARLLRAAVLVLLGVLVVLGLA